MKEVNFFSMQFTLSSNKLPGPWYIGIDLGPNQAGQNHGMSPALSATKGRQACCKHYTKANWSGNSAAGPPAIGQSTGRLSITGPADLIIHAPDEAHARNVIATVLAPSTDW